MKKPSLAILLAGLLSGGYVLAMNYPGLQIATSGMLHTDRPINIDENTIFTPMAFGARGDGVADDTRAVQQAIDRAANSTLYLGRHRYCVNSLSISAPVRISGAIKGTPLGHNQPALIACSANQSLITIRKTASGTILQNFAILMGQSGIANTRGTAIIDRAYLTRVANVLINAPCVGIDEDGNSNTYDGVQITYVQGGSCAGIRFGNGMTGDGSIDARVINNTITGNYNSPGGTGMEFLAAGGTYLANNDILYTRIGTAVIPGAKQSVHWLFFSNTVLGDSILGDALRVDTDAASAIIGGLKFAGTWTGSAGRNQREAVWEVGNGVTIDNSAGGTVAGIHFVGHRAFASGAAGISIGPRVSDVTIDASAICASSSYRKDTYWGVVLRNNAGDVAIRNSKISGSCDNANGPGEAAAIQLGRGLNNILITGNNLAGDATPIGGSLSGAGASAIIAENLGIDDRESQIVSAATIDLPVNPTVRITGTVGIRTMNGGWRGRKVTLILENGAMTFGGVGGNFCSGGRFTQLVTAAFDTTYGCWRLSGS